MALFSNPFSGNQGKTPEDDYSKGVLCLKANDFYGANDFFKSAARGGHVSALYDLGLINSMGRISPYEIDFAISCFHNAAAGGHAKAKDVVGWLNDKTFDITKLSWLSSIYPAEGWPNIIVTMVGCRLYNALCIEHDVTDSVIDYELDAARFSEHSYIQNFINRTGISGSVYSGGLNRIQEGSVVDAITDGLNNLYVGLKGAGHSDQICLLTRCTIVGYIISKSRHARRAMPLLGTDKFFA